MDKLPKPSPGMMVDKYLYLELMHILVEEGILTEEKAIKRCGSHGIFND